MAEPNYAGNIIVSLASLPDFLRRPILEKRLGEFFAMTDAEQREIVSNALEAGPDIPFPNFARLCRTWLEVIAGFGEGQRAELFGMYVREIAGSPEKIVRFNLDGMLEILSSLDQAERGAVGASIVRAVNGLGAGDRELVLKLVPDNAKKVIGLPP